MCVADGMPAAGLVFLGYPLHPPGKPERLRAEHLERISVPMLFLQGTRDPFARTELLEGVLERLGDRATLVPVEGGDHSFRVRGRRRTTGRSAPRSPARPRRSSALLAGGSLMPRRNRRAPEEVGAVSAETGLGGSGVGARPGLRGPHASTGTSPIDAPAATSRSVPGTRHLVVVPEGAPDERRHWHEGCWRIELNRTRGRHRNP